MVEIIKLIRAFEFSASGGIAIYFILCTVFVTVIGGYHLVKNFVSLFK